MLISKKYKFIFVHIQKTGGTSVMVVLSKNIPDLKPLCFKHDGAVEGIAELGEDEWKTYFKFAFVRNPWDRLLSWYSMIINTPDRITKLRSYVRKNSNNFDEFIKNCTESIMDDDGIQSFSKNQIDYLVNNNGELAIDYIGRFEDLDKSFRYFLKKVKLDEKIKLPHVNHASTHKHYSTYYSESTIDLVGKRFSKDIEKFEYSFEKKSLISNLMDTIKVPVGRKRDIDQNISYMDALKKGSF
jgi:hypothetical protein